MASRPQAEREMRAIGPRRSIWEGVKYVTFSRRSSSGYVVGLRCRRPGLRPPPGDARAAGPRRCSFAPDAAWT